MYKFFSMRKHQFLLALCRWDVSHGGWRNICPESGQKSSYIVLVIVYEWQTKDKRPQRSNVNEKNL